MLLAVFHEYACAMNGSAGAEALNREEILSFAQFNLFFHFFFLNGHCLGMDCWIRWGECWQVLGELVPCRAWWQSWRSASCGMSPLQIRQALALRKDCNLVNTKPGTGRKSDSVLLVS